MYLICNIFVISDDVDMQIC